MVHDPLQDLIYDSFGIIDEDMIDQMSNVFDQDRPYQSTTDRVVDRSRRGMGQQIPGRRTPLVRLLKDSDGVISLEDLIQSFSIFLRGNRDDHLKCKLQPI